ncbi:hypothetical protein ACJIZ3_011502 [Penstemon smallii]|uniref:Myb-like domain-containing protein n=1 Tax=Penstemon smallii TaxID=265156 RepID=A0ABD3UJQ2_9LAMI
MGDSEVSGPCEWSWEENKLFEVAIAEVGEKDSDRWEAVAAMIGGHKSAEDVYKHFLTLLHDLNLIESGYFDHTLEKIEQEEEYVISSIS